MTDCCRTSQVTLTLGEAPEDSKGASAAVLRLRAGLIPETLGIHFQYVNILKNTEIPL